MKRKSLLTLIALFSVVSAYAADKLQIGDLYYLLDTCSKAATVTSPPSRFYSGNITIPSTISYDNVVYSVTNIGNDAFYFCTGLTSITIPKSVTHIGGAAFSGCTCLTSVVWNAKKCGGWNYYNGFPFDSTCKNITSFTFGNEVDSIPAYLCKNMTSLASITIGNSVTSIGEDAFLGCTGLTSVVWNAKKCSITPSSSEYIGAAPFYSARNNITSFGLIDISCT